MNQSTLANNSIRRRIMAGGTVFGTFGFLPDPAVIEIMGLAGLDFVVIDMEHSPKNWQTVENMVRAAELRGISALIRVNENNEKTILHALEVGAAGVMVPFIQTAEDAVRAGAAVRYPPLGIRGSCTLSRSADFGAKRGEYQAHTQRSNKEILLIGLLENMAAVENIEEIARAEPGPDVFLVGRSDLATSLGKPGLLDSEAVIEATHRIIRAVASVAEKNRSVGMGVYGPKEVKRWLRHGCRLFAFSSDTAILFNALRSLKQEYEACVRAPARKGPNKRS